jgi:sugar porter (SP) family MFS transporter
LAAAEARGRKHITSPRAAVATVTAVAAIGGFLFGYDTGVISGALLYIPRDFQLTGFTKGAIVSGLLLGAMIGALIAGTLADRIGRKPTIIFAAATFIAGILLAIFAPTIWTLIAGRFVIGLGVGATSDTVPLYIGEVAPPEARGRLVSMNQLMITTGILVAYLIDYALSSTGSWQAMLAIGIVPATLLGIGMMFMFESPRWLLTRNRRDEATQVLRKIGQEDLLQTELADASPAQPLKRDWRQLLAPNLRRVMLIGIGLAVLQQVTGINTVIYYAPTILKQAGLGSMNSILASVPVGVINVVVTVISIMIIDKVGRKPLLVASLSGMVVTIAGLALSFGLSAPSWTKVVCLVAYVGSFAIGMGPVFWLLIAEIYPLRARGEAMSVATSANWMANFGVALAFPLLISSIGIAAVFWIFAGMGIVAIAFCLTEVPETKGRSLEEIEATLVGT